MARSKIGTKNGNKLVGGQMSWADVGNNVYDGAAQYGRFMSWVSLVIGTLIGFVFSAIGFYVTFILENKHTAKTKANVKTASCVRDADDQNKNNNINCDLTVEYTINSVPRNAKLFANALSQYIAPGSTIDIRYDPSNPDDITRDTNPALFGWIFMGVGTLVIMGSVASWYAAQNYQIAAAATGVHSIASMFSGTDSS